MKGLPGGLHMLASMMGVKPEDMQQAMMQMQHGMSQLSSLGTDLATIKAQNTEILARSAVIMQQNALILNALERASILLEHDEKGVKPLAINGVTQNGLRIG